MQVRRPVNVNDIAFGSKSRRPGDDKSRNAHLSQNRRNHQVGNRRQRIKAITLPDIFHFRLGERTRMRCFARARRHLRLSAVGLAPRIVDNAEDDDNKNKEEEEKKDNPEQDGGEDENEHKDDPEQDGGEDENEHKDDDPEQKSSARVAQLEREVADLKAQLEASQKTVAKLTGGLRSRATAAGGQSPVSFADKVKALQAMKPSDWDAEFIALKKSDPEGYATFMKSVH